ncbi:MAG: SUMF1/EgtB/PvdO family nonheme iron enzyme [Candidatus Hydrogenedentes bacterium]|nr:SUMF1/EgtB/PvdO family nonheme iron enzyme [Candidatus Hydrogenedentota bacterium]
MKFFRHVPALYGYLALLVFMPVSSEADPVVKAFPTAEGFGAATPGGRGGAVLFVTTLEDFDPGKEKPIAGSLRAAVDTDGPRTILFRIGGTIALKSDLWITKPFVTIAGQSAPGGGICIRDYQLVLATNNVILRHVRIRSGDVTRKEQMALGIFGGNNSIVDHCSLSWAIDEVMSSFGAVHNLTVQWSIIAEGLSKSYHPKGEHSKGSILNGDGGVTIHHSVYAHNASRNTRIDNILLDFRNNVVYNWGYRCGYTRSGPIFVNYVNNYFKPGPSTRKAALTKIFVPGDNMARMFLVGNVLEGVDESTENNTLLVYPPSGHDAAQLRNTVVVQEPFSSPTVLTDSARTAMDRILADAGATKPLRDSADVRLLEEVRAGTGKIIDSQDEVGNWPELAAGTLSPDSDNDGMPDDWETLHALNSKSESADADSDGYTDLEEFLNETNPNAAEAGASLDPKTFTSIQRSALALASKGMQEQLQQERSDTAKRAAQIEQIKKTLRVAFTPMLSRDGIERVTVNLGNETSLTLVRIPPGNFLMGSPDNEGGLENERPQHKVTISRPYYMAATPTTTAEYCAVFGSEARALSRENAELPAKEITWFEAVEFCEILSAITGETFRLPTEAEWEYACRAGTATAFHTGEMIASDQANFNALEATPFSAVGHFERVSCQCKRFLQTRGASMTCTATRPNGVRIYVFVSTQPKRSLIPSTMVRMARAYCAVENREARRSTYAPPAAMAIRRRSGTAFAS